MRARFFTIIMGAACAAAVFGSAHAREEEEATNWLVEKGLEFGSAHAREEEDLSRFIGAMMTGLEEAAERGDSFRPLIDRSHFEAMEIVDRLDFDGDAIARHVAEEIRYEPYAGVLRGAQATLSAGGGNALDQSLILLEMLELAGYDAQILSLGETPPEIRAALTEAAFTRRPAAGPFTDPEQARLWIAEAGAEVYGAEDHADLAEALFDVEHSEQISERLTAAAETLSGGVDRTGAVREPGAYYWVRYRLSSGMPWTEAHPALGGAEAGEVSPDTVLSGTADDDMLHFLTLELFVEILEQDSLRLSPIMSPWRQPVATLLDRPISLSMAVSGADGGPAGAYFTPMLNGQPPSGAQATTLSGAMIDQGVLDMDDYGMAGLFTSLGDQLLDASDLVGAREEGRPSRAATGLLMRVTWTQPDGAERVEERWILDRLANRFDEGEPPRLDLSLTREAALDKLNFGRNILVSPGGAHAAFALDRMTEALSLRSRHLAAMLNAYDADTGEFDEQALPAPLAASHIPVLMQMVSALNAPLAWPEDRGAFRHGPLVISVHMDDSAEHCEDTPPGEINAFIDVLINPWTGIALDDGTIRDWPQGAVIRGVRDTAVEVAHAGVPDEWDYLERLGADARALTAHEIMAWPQDARLAAESDLGEGFSLISLMVEDEEAPLLWWRVSAEGETLGRHARGGFAQVYGEYGTIQKLTAVNWMGNAISALSFANSVRQCLQQSSAESQACCLGAAVASGALGVAAPGVDKVPGLSGLATQQFATWGQAVAGMLVLEGGAHLAGEGMGMALCGSRGL